MELEGKSFVTLQANLKELYEKVELLIKEDSDPESVRALLDNVNEASSQLEKAIRLHDDSSKREFLITQLYNLHSEKACFNKFRNGFRKSYPSIPKRRQLRQVLYLPLMVRNSELLAVAHEVRVVRVVHAVVCV